MEREPGCISEADWEPPDGDRRHGRVRRLIHSRDGIGPGVDDPDGMKIDGNTQESTSINIYGLSPGVPGVVQTLWSFIVVLRIQVCWRHWQQRLCRTLGVERRQR